MIDARAVVSPQAELASDVEVGAFAVIGPGVRIGARTRVASHAVITGNTSIGADNQIFQFASIGDAPQDLKYKGERAETRIGNRNRIREFVTIHRGTAGGGLVTSIGSDNLLMVYTHVAHDVRIGDHVVIVNASKIAVGQRKLLQKTYHRHSGYPGGIRTESLEHLLARDPEKVVRLAVKRMLPKGPLGRSM